VLRAPPSSPRSRPSDPRPPSIATTITRGTITLYTGTFHADGNLYYEATQFGSTNKIRMTFFNQGPAQVRQLGHISSDGGKTWAVSFDLTYVRKK
jgi:hypothetical protein